MPPATSDRELRRIVANLAFLEPHDVAAVMGDLDAKQRQTVERLLREFPGFALPPAVEGCDTTRLSSWLAQRLQPELSDCAMTNGAHDALRGCAMELFPAPIVQRRPGFFARLASAISGQPTS
jgi:hypothetical protein